MKTLNTRTGLAALSVTLMLALSACGGGAQAAGESSEAATNAPAATASVERVCCFHAHYCEGLGICFCNCGGESEGF